MTSGDNTTSMKMNRAYERLLCAIIEQKPKSIIDGFLWEYCACDSKHQALMGENTTFEEYQAKTFLDAVEEAKNYYSHRQGARSTIVLKKSPLGRKLRKGAFSENEEE